MKKEVAEALREAAAEMVGHEVEVNENYSGRGMYGAKTHALVLEGNLSLLFKTIAFAGAVVGEKYGQKSEVYEFAEEVGKLRIDSMGRDDVVVY